MQFQINKFSRNNKFGRNNNDDGLIEKVVNVNRVSKVVKGGRRFGTAALVVVGNGKGKVGYGTGKAKEFPQSIKKATEKAKKNMKNYPLKKNRTIHYDIQGKHGAGNVIIKSAPPGTGIIAGGPMRPVFEALGIKDIVAKSIGTTNPHNMIRATFDALNQLDSLDRIAFRRGKKITDLFYKKEKNEKETINKTK